MWARDTLGASLFSRQWGRGSRISMSFVPEVLFIQQFPGSLLSISWPPGVLPILLSRKKWSFQPLHLPPLSSISLTQDGKLYCIYLATWPLPSPVSPHSPHTQTHTSLSYLSSAFPPHPMIHPQHVNHPVLQWSVSYLFYFPSQTDTLQIVKIFKASLYFHKSRYLAHNRNSVSVC